jgi:hypothetical protein
MKGRLSAENSQTIPDRLPPHAVGCTVRMGSAMRCCDHPLVMPERTICWWRLFCVNVQRRASKMPRIEGIQQRLLIE